MMIMRAQRMRDVRSDIRGPLFEEALRMQADGLDVLKLNTGNPGTFGFGLPDSLRQALLAGMDRAVPYSDLRGMADARQSILSYHQGKGVQGLAMDDIYLGNGVSELAHMALTALFNPGDELLLPAPCYTLWSNTARLMDARPVFYRCDEASGWYPDAEDIRRKITPRTRGLLIINPNNPTGALYPRPVLEELLDIAREHRLLVFSDEIYDRLVFDDAPHTATAALAPDLPVITMNGLSKSHNVCGFRSGWMVVSGPRERTREILTGFTQLAAMRLCANTLMQLVVPAALADNESTQAMIRPGGRLYEQRRATLEVLGTVEGISFVPNAAAFYLFPKLDTQLFGITDDRAFAMDLLHATNILVIPGSGFELDTPDHLRIVMLPEAAQLRAAMERMKEYLETRRA
ncbi:MAG: aminotransferase class I/II-fold pyridoxal phosphate-dependent enzyme [Clostridiales bacterium]|nr:aminotransferase class I/II-fold pyridoxal phosphate-dependent enzyme [Clostridiales bacterium]